MPRPPQPISFGFWQRVDQSGGPEACWPWIGAINRGGYGTLERGNKRYGNRHVYLAHRVAYELTNGPRSLDAPNVLHRCDNPPCCNPAHLFAGTQLDNIADMTAKGRAAWRGKEMPIEFRSRGERHGNAKLNEEKVRTIRNLSAKGLPQWEIATQFGIHQVHVSRIVLRKVWRHVG